MTLAEIGPNNEDDMSSEEVIKNAYEKSKEISRISQMQEAKRKMELQQIHAHTSIMANQINLIMMGYCAK